MSVCCMLIVVVTDYLRRPNGDDRWRCETALGPSNPPKDVYIWTKPPTGLPLLNSTVCTHVDVCVLRPTGSGKEEIKSESQSCLHLLRWNT